MRKRLFTLELSFVFVFLCSSLSMIAQQQTFYADSLTKQISLSSYMELVKQNHPAIKVALGQVSMAEAEMLSAKGGFDPKLYTKLDQKYFKDNNYYSVLNGGVTVPTWLGLDLDVNYSENEGAFLNPMKTTPTGGLLSVGASLNIGKGLLFDQRRATYRNAQLMLQMGENEKRLQVNMVLMNAYKTYWKWYIAYENLQVLNEGLILAKTRLSAVKSQAVFGDKPAIDTVEALSQVQNREADLIQGKLDVQNQTLYLSAYLWGENLIPLELSSNAFPKKDEESIAANPLANIADTSLVNNPLLVSSRLKLQQIQVEKKLAKEMYKPTIKLKYNALQEPVGDLVNNYNMNNYTWGFQFGMPLLFRKERGKLRLLKAKEEIQQYELELKQKQLQVKIDAAINKLQALVDQTKVFKDLVNNYAVLVAAENKIFKGGEGSLFLVNSRESKYIEGYLKYNTIRLKAMESQAELNYLLSNFEE